MKFPSISKFLQALLRFVKRPEVVPLPVENARKKICHDCDERVFHQCLQCTCFIPLKIKLSTESCPLQKWGEYHNPLKDGI